jgi:hypothetical protein
MEDSMEISTTNRLSRWAGLFGLTFAVVLTASVAAFSQTVNLGTAGNFGVLASAAITGTSIVTGNVGTTDPLAAIAVTISVTAGYTKYDPTDSADQIIVNAAHDDLVLAYNDAATRGSATVLSAATYDFAGATINPGVYSVGTSAAMTTSMTLDGAGIYIFQIGTTLNTTAGVTVNLINGAVWSDVFWQVGTAVTIAGTTTFEGTILGHDAITVGAASTVHGRLLAGAIVAGAVSDDASTVALPVEMVLFTASTSGLNAQLHWSTATEVDNDGFEIERRSVGSESIGQWLKVGFVPGAGTSSSPHQYSYADQGLAQGRYDYRIKQIDRNGSFKYSSAAQVEVGTAPKEFTLSQSYPNPFNPSTTVEFSVARNDRAVVRVFNVLGQEVATLFDGTAEAGKLYQARFDASRMSSGMYFVQLQSNGQSKMQKMVFLK